VRWSDRWKTIQKPVFTSYVFVHVTEAERLEVLNDPGVVRSVFYLKKPGVVREEEIKAIRLFLEEFHEVEMEQFKPMQRVVVKEGPLVGEAGNIVSTSGGYARLRLESMGINLIAKVHIHKLSEIKST
jgi:transcription antitermination factor NusG